jgi:hypothetical protein
MIFFYLKESNLAFYCQGNVKPRFKPAPSNETLDFIAKARTEVTTNRQTNLGVKLFQGTKMYSTMHNYALAIKGEI